MSRLISRVDTGSTSYRQNFADMTQRVAALRDESKVRLGRLLQRADACIVEGSCTVEAALRFIDWLEPLMRRESYLALKSRPPRAALRRIPCGGAHYFYSWGTNA